MLKIWVNGFQEGCIKDPNSYFNLHKKKDWFNRSDVKEVIKEIENTIAVKDDVILADEKIKTNLKIVINNGIEKSILKKETINAST